MRFPEWLYRLLAGDEGSQQLGVIWRENSGSASNVTVGITIYTVPADKCLVLTNFTAQFAPGAGQIVSRERLMADPPDGSVRYNLYDEELPGGAAGAPTSANWQGEVVIPGGWKVRAEGSFDAAIAANATAGELHGYLIPRGSFIFG